MSDYFALLAARLAGAPEAVRPVVPSRFEPVSPGHRFVDTAGSTPQEIVEERGAEQPSRDPPRAPSRPATASAAPNSPSPRGGLTPPPPTTAVPPPSWGKSGPPAPVSQSQLPVAPHPPSPSPAEPFLRVVAPAQHHPISADTPPTLAAPIRPAHEFMTTSPKIQFVPVVVSTRPAFEPTPPPSTEAAGPRLSKVSESPAETPKLAGGSPSHPSEAFAHVHRSAPNAAAGFQTPKPAASPAIHISIGRIEVQAIMPPPPPVAAPRKTVSPEMSLDDYLKRRNSPGS